MCCFFDLRKAFDSLDHSILISRLQQLGVCGIELQWFQNYLTDHCQRGSAALVSQTEDLLRGTFLRVVPLAHCFS